jgi:F0F1-type ATP synthase assembly protein I
VVKLIEDLHSVSCLLNVQSDAWIVVTLIIKYGAGVVEVKKSTGIEKTTFASKTCNSEKY